MATIFSYTDAGFSSPEQEVRFIADLGEAVRTGLDLAPNLKSVYNFAIDPIHTTKKDRPEITVFIYTAPDKTLDQKRKVVENVKESVDRTFGEDSVNTVVIFKIHDDENVGVNGVIRKDAKANASK